MPITATTVAIIINLAIAMISILCAAYHLITAKYQPVGDADKSDTCHKGTKSEDATGYLIIVGIATVALALIAFEKILV